jgi:uncharacterized protein (DUF58 family)
MIPRLTARGKWILASALLFILVGAVIAAPPLVGVGGMMMAVLLALHLGFYPVAIMLRRKKVELSWWVAATDQQQQGIGAITAQREFTTHIAYRNHSSRRLRILSTDILQSSALETLTPPIASIGQGQQVETTTVGIAHAAGYWHMHGAALVFGDALGLFDIEAYFPNPIAIKVYPRGFANRLAVQSNPGMPQQAASGLRKNRRRGQSGELRELRDHVPGDALKSVAWKATARKRKLMVRDVETEIVRTQMLLIDIGSHMRQAEHGHNALDWALTTVCGLARQANQAGDRFGMIAFDTRVVFETGLGTGASHFNQLNDRLLESNCIVDHDLTDVTPGELVGQVAKYLAHQEAIDIRLPSAPPLDDPRWNQIVAGADGQLYDVGVAGKLTTRLVDAVVTRDKKGGLRGMMERCLEPDLQLVPLRKFCRLRGIELPYQPHWEHGKRSAGLVAALSRVPATVEVIHLVSDIVGFEEDELVVIRALGLLRQRRVRVSLWSPPSISPVDPAASQHAKRVRSLLQDDWDRQRVESRRLLRKGGVR